MLAVQHRLPLVPVRTRRARRPFHPSQEPGPYRLPHAVRDRLAAALAPYRNRDAAFALAVFLARFWSVPGRVAGAFPIDRRALADHAILDLTEARVRGAIRTLEAVGFLDRAIPAPGSLYKPTEDGLHRKPILYVFGADYAPAFIAANARAAATRGRRFGDRRSVLSRTRGTRLRPFLRLQTLSRPKAKAQRNPPSDYGRVKKRLASTGLCARLPLEAALERLRRAAEGQGLLRAEPRRDS